MMIFLITIPNIWKCNDVVIRALLRQFLFFKRCVKNFKVTFSIISINIATIFRTMTQSGRFFFTSNLYIAVAG